eukprot:CAMPEP_0197023574 /NCGR_PEP_ID=MMETSP1384-20130603/4243_1 /TAXON_ID=29189 /ORGANISM="Ammonia sp." /LENGTH=510 /DNA_ID=CAMNT_0042451807 /DNA_START=29 /DNA_END=1561 /DNA_ORIENTATION=+
MSEPQQPSWYGSGGRFRNKIYVGNLSSRTRENDIKERFSKYGKVAAIVLKYDFAFVEMENEKDIDKAIDNLDEYDCHGRKWVVEPARRGPNHPPKAPHHDNHRRNAFSNGYANDYPPYGHYSGSTRGGFRSRRGNASTFQRKPAGVRPQRGDYRIQVLGLSSATSWQDLKDWARKAGDSVCYGDVFVDCGRRMGIIEYSSKDDYMYALTHLNKDKLHGKKLVVYKDGDIPPNLNGMPDDEDDGKEERDNGKDSDSLSRVLASMTVTDMLGADHSAVALEGVLETVNWRRLEKEAVNHERIAAHIEIVRITDITIIDRMHEGTDDDDMRTMKRVCRIRVERADRGHALDLDIDRYDDTEARVIAETERKDPRKEDHGLVARVVEVDRSRNRRAGRGRRSASRSQSVGSSKSKERENGKKSKRDEVPTETALSGHKETKTKKNGDENVEPDGDVKMEMNGKAAKESKKDAAKKADAKKTETKNTSTAKERRGGSKSVSRSRSRSKSKSRNSA